MQPITKQASNSNDCALEKEKQVIELIEERVAGLHKIIPRDSNFAKGNGGTSLARPVFEYVKDNPCDPKIWDLVFRKIPHVSVSIPFGHGYTCTLPLALWNYHIHYHQGVLPLENKDSSPDTIEACIQSLQACSSQNILTQENWQKVMELAKRYCIRWLFVDCVQFGLEQQLGKDLGNEVLEVWKPFSYESWKFQDLTKFISCLISKFPKIDLDKVIAAVYPSINDNEPFTVYFDHGQSVTLPLYLWKEHSDYFGKLAAIPMKNQVPHENFGISKESIEAFIQCLVACTSYNIINVENYSDIAALADKYQVSWLKKECEDFSYPFLISQFLSCSYHGPFKTILETLIENKISLCLNAMKALDQLADQYRLFTLKLYANKVSLEILPGDGLLISESNALLQTLLSMEVPWSVPKIELNYEYYPSSENEFDALYKIIEMAKHPITLKFEYYCPYFSETSDVLCQMLNKSPCIKHLKIEVVGKEEGSILPIFNMIRENKTLESLSIIVSNGKVLEQNGWSEERITGAIRDALKENEHIQNVSLCYSDHILDSRCRVDDQRLVRNYDF